MFNVFLKISSFFGLAAIVAVPLFIYFALAIWKASKRGALEKRHGIMKKTTFSLALIVTLNYLALVATASKTDAYAAYILFGSFVLACPYWIAALAFLFVKTKSKTTPSA